MSAPQISGVRTKASSLSETGYLQGSIWQPGHCTSRLDDLGGWKMPIMEASFRSLGRTEQTRYTPSSVFCSLSLALLLSPPLALSLSPLPATLSLSFSHLVFTLNAGCWAGEVGRRRQDTLFVSQWRTCLAELRFQPRCQTKSCSVQELEDKL